MKNKKIANNRWFIWALVVIILGGIALVSYVMYSDDGLGNDAGWVTHRGYMRSYQGMHK